MTACNAKTSYVAVIFVVFVVLGCHDVWAARIIDGEQWLRVNYNLVIQSLPRGPVPSSGANPCTQIPGSRRKGRCTMENTGQVNAAAHVETAVVRDGAASEKSNSKS
nr:hypothetical protein BC332_30066 [Ipomoea trifida]GMC92734.1 Threonylcarbamoyl-AMP synthase [Ipomoea batatas]